MFVFFVVLDFLLCFDNGGLDPHLPLFPIPRPRPRVFALEMEPRVKVPRLNPVPTNLTFCFVFALQYGQKRFTVFGTFILEKDKVGF